MSSLRELQEQFQTYIHQQKNGIENKIVDAPQISIKDRVEIYREGYYLRLIDILEREFSALRNLVGKEQFDALCHEYIDAYPSTYFSVRAYGKNMIEFLSNRPNTDLLHVELARFEWPFGKVIDAPDAPQLTVDDMAALPAEAWGTLRLEFHPSLQIVSLHYNTPEIWQALFNNNPEEFPVPERVYSEEPQDCLVWRFNQRSHYLAINLHHKIMVEAIQSNKTFSDICEALCDHMEVEQVAQFAGGSLRDWINSGLISRFTY